MSKVQIKVLDNGSLRVTGEFEVIDVDGNIFPTKETVSLCRCGKSSRKPYCDGSHREGFNSVERAVPAEGE
ncbi:CDGSH iron-sulfur domain-containing protein [Bacillus sp. 1P06AnD]|uniref:CDGSH iron-sulfur domain-containing protein n=1 Tax=Bacillus sp. 1P06AnD TaxID=3132208 RepID=UPI0039A275B9